MKQFDTLLESLNWQTTCPLCTGPVRLVSKNDARLVRSSSHGPKDHIMWSSFDTKIFDTKIIADLATNHLERCEVSSRPIVGSSNNQFNIRVTGSMFVRAAMACVKCYCYGYVVQVRLNIDEAQISSILLNSETICVEDSTRNLTHEIHNIYAIDKTEYTSFAPALNGLAHRIRQSYSDNKSITLPLITLNLMNPQKTVERIRTLIPFS